MPYIYIHVTKNQTMNGNSFIFVKHYFDYTQYIVCFDVDLKSKILQFIDIFILKPLSSKIKLL